MKQEKKTIKVALRENKTATADKAPYLMTVIPNGTAGIPELVASMREDGACRRGGVRPARMPELPRPAHRGTRRRAPRDHPCRRQEGRLPLLRLAQGEDSGITVNSRAGV